MRLLTFSTLYPNAAQPHHGVFVENRLRHLLETQDVESRVVAPVPWFPSWTPAFGGYGVYARVPGGEIRHGIEVRHPRYPVVPKIGMTVAPVLLARWALPALRAIRSGGYEFDMIDAHYFYPDGVAAVMLAQQFGVPVTITARGTDINLIPRHALPRRMIRWAARQADGIVTVCQALKDALVDLDVEQGKIRVLRNGVDLDRFRPGDRRAARRRFEISGTAIASVGHLIPRKGHDLVVRALASLPDAVLLIAGEGPEDANLRRVAREAGVEERVRFLGRLAHEDLPELYGAVDALVLASSREGWANVLLEAMACGTPVAATDIWGTPEVVATPEAGLLIPERTPQAIAATVGRLLADLPRREATRAYAERFGWDDTSHGQARLFSQVLAAHAGAAAQPPVKGPVL